MWRRLGAADLGIPNPSSSQEARGGRSLSGVDGAGCGRSVALLDCGSDLVVAPTLVPWLTQLVFERHVADLLHMVLHDLAADVFRSSHR